MYFIDVQGTLITDDTRLPTRGSVRFIDTLNKNHTSYMVVTNNTKHASDDFLQYLNDIGLAIPKENYLDPLMLLEDRVDKNSVAAYGTDEFLAVLSQMGYKFDFQNPQTVIVSIKADFTFDEFAQMTEFLLAGAKLVGMHETALYKKNEKRYPGVGAILRMLSFATSVEYETIGKPSRNFYDTALECLKSQAKDVTFEDITIVSDDLKGDLVKAAALGMRTILVLSGKYKKADEILPFVSQAEQPDLIFEDIQEMMERV